MSPRSRDGHRVMIVGVGSIGERHLRCFLATGRADVCFAEPKRELREEIAARYPNATAFESPDAAVSFGVTAAVVATPAPLHIPIATQLVDRDVHCLIEKPLSLTDAGIAELDVKAKSKNATIRVAYVYRSHPVLAEMKQALASGAFGKVLELVVVAGQCFPFYRPAYKQTYYASRAMGGGAVQDALTHALDAGQWLAGPITRVVADGAHLAIEGVEVEDTVHVLARQGSGSLATYSLNQHQAPNEFVFTVACERGTLRFENHLNRWRSMEKPGTDWTDHPGTPLERDTLFTSQANAFLDAIEGKPTVLSTLAEGVQTLNATNAILRSMDGAGWQHTEAA